MSDQYLSEIRAFSFGLIPKGWVLCSGQLLPISQNQALFTLLGTTYGGDGQTTFALPNLQGGIPVHVGNGFVLGQAGGEAAVALTVAQIPSHSHGVVASSNAESVSSPSNAYWATLGTDTYDPGVGGNMDSGALSIMGGGQAHQNMSPYLALSFCIALTGIFPPRS